MAGRPELPIKHTGPIADHAKRLRVLRDHADLTNRLLAERAGLAPSTVTDALSGRKLPTWPTTSKIVAACGGNVAAWEPGWKDAEHAIRAPKQRSMPALVLAGADETSGSRSAWPLSRRPGEYWASDSLPPGPAPLPVNAHSAEQFVACLQRVKIWAGDPPFRVLARRVGMPNSSLHTVVKRKTTKMPSWELVYAFLLACGVNDQAVIEEWRYTWRWLKAAEVEIRRRGSHRRLVSA
jgi:transcriptional regulator with XRE-family HTH domain